MGKYKKLLKNIFYFFAGNMGSKILIFLLVPYYTHVLTTAEYGIADLISTTSMLIIPIITLSITEAVFRFSMDKDVNMKELFSNGLFVVFIGNILFGVCVLFLKKMNVSWEYMIFLQMLVLIDSIYNVTAQFIRGKGQTGIYAVSGVVQTCALVILNLWFLLGLKLGIKGYVLAMIISYLIALIYMFVTSNIYGFLGKPNICLLRNMLQYSIPMIPSGLSWWGMSSADKYIILSSAGAEINGIYLVAQKIPTILNVFITIFQQAWQIAAVAENESESGDIQKFSAQIFRYLQMTMFLCASALICILKPLYAIWVDAAYYSAWECTPLLLLATVYSCMSQFMTTNYIVSKKTIGNLKVTVIGCVTNIILNLILVPKYGMLAAAFTTFIGYLVIFLMTIHDIMKTMIIEISRNRLVFSTIVLILQAIVLYMPMRFLITLEILLFILHVYTYRKEIYKLIKILVESYQRYRR